MDGGWVCLCETGVAGRHMPCGSVKERMRWYHTPAVSVAVVKEGEIVHTEAMGCIDTECNVMARTTTLFQAASISKAIFAMAVMKLKETGMVDIHADVVRFLGKEVLSSSLKGWYPKVTLQQLLSHTGGLNIHGFPGYHKEKERLPSSLLDVIHGEKESNTNEVLVTALPGMSYSYSGGGTTLAQMYLMKVMKTDDFPALMRQVILDPLQMKDTTFEILSSATKGSREVSVGFPYKGLAILGGHHDYIESAAAGMWTTPTDLANAVISLYRSARGLGGYLSQKSAQEMLAPNPVYKGIGIGFHLNNDWFSHSGWNEGFVCRVTMNKETGDGLAIMMNSNEGSSLINEIERAVAMKYEWKGYFPAEDIFVDRLNDDTVRSLQGSWVSDRTFPSFQLQPSLSQPDVFLLHLETQQESIPLRLNQKNELKNPDLGFILLFDTENETLTLQQHNTSVLYTREPGNTDKFNDLLLWTLPL